MHVNGKIWRTVSDSICAWKLHGFVRICMILCSFLHGRNEIGHIANVFARCLRIVSRPKFMKYCKKKGVKNCIRRLPNIRQNLIACCCSVQLISKT